VSSRTEDSGRRHRTSPGEYVLGAIGGLLVLALLAFFVYQAVVPRDSPPRLDVVVTGIEQAGETWSVTFRLHNDGGETAEQIQISGTLQRDGRQVEEATAVVSFLPPDSTQTGALLFTTDPRSGELQVEPSGYSLP